MTFTNDEILRRACEVLVVNFRNQVAEDRRVVHSRIFNYFLHPEFKYVHYGSSTSVTSTSKNHPEHVVPCAVMTKEIFRLMEETNLSNEKIASLLHKHWKIVTITKEESKRLDSTLNLKAKMPLGWTFETGDTFARLKEAKIEVIPNIDAGL